MLSPGRRIWFLNKVGTISHMVGPLTVLSVRQILPAGKTVSGEERKRSLVQLYTDPGGVRTLAAADIWAKDPGRSDNPW